MFHLVNNHQNRDVRNYLEIFLKTKTPDCIIYSEDGAEFKTHKEIFGQSEFMRELLKSQSCCGLMEVIFPCSKEELEHLMNFLHTGKMKCNQKNDLLKMIENLNKILGFPDDCIENIRMFVLDEKDKNDVDEVSKSIDNKVSEEPITIKEEVKAVGKEKALSENESNESESAKRCKIINFCLLRVY